MQTETRKEIDRLLAELRDLRYEVYTFDYDYDTLLCLDNATTALKEAIR